MMKKVLLLLVIALIGTQMYAQEGFKVGLNLGLPIGDAVDVSGFSVGADVKHHWEVADSFYAGVATGFTNSFGKVVDIGVDFFRADNVQFLPVAGSASYLVSDKFNVGLDLGYAVGINDGNDGGIYYRPLVGYGITESSELNLSYTGISLDGGTWSTINLGFLYKL